MNALPLRKALQILAQVAELAASEHEAEVVRLCGDDADVLAAVREMLAAGHRPARVLDSTTLDSDPSLAAEAAPDQASVEEGPGSWIRAYRLVQQIGEGGFGSVFLAEQERPVQRQVALKIIKLGMDTRQVVARFQQERQALALMEHPNIAKVFDAGVTSTGRPYFVMELCKGEPITDYCDRHNLAIPDRLSLFVQVCQAVQHAHQKALIHRDIKPSNILVSTEDGRPSAKVIDFGIAKAMASKLTENTLLTQVEQMVGTPQYMSPEQAEGSFDIDTRTDVYSLGVLLYELLTGSTPFDAKSLRGAAYGEIQRIIREVEPPKPSARLTQSGQTIASVAARRDTEPRKLGTIVRGELDWIVMKALEKDRTRRYETANGLAADVQRYLSNEPVVAGPPGMAYRVRKFIRRNRVMVSAAAVVAASLVIGAAAFAWQASVARRAADTAERAAYQAQMVSAADAIEGQRIAAASALLAATSPRLRGWEYRHLASRLDRSLPSPFPAKWRVTRINVAADSGTVAVLRSDEHGSNNWVVLNPDLRTELFVMPGTDGGRVALSPDGTRAVWVPDTIGDQRPCVLWNINTKSVLATIPTTPIQRIEDLVMATWNAAGDRLAVARHDGFELFDGRTGSRLSRKAVSGHVAFTGDDRWMLVEGSPLNPEFGASSLRLLDARTFEPQPEVFKFSSPLALLGINFFHSRLACSVQDGTLHLLDIVDGVLRERFSIPAGIGVLYVPEWSHDGHLVAVGSYFNGRVGVWDADSGVSRGDFPGWQSATGGLLFLPDSGDLVTSDMEGHHRAWPIRRNASEVLTAHRSFVYPAVISKDGGLLLTGGWDGAAGQSGGLKLWDARTGTLVAEYGRPGEIYHSADLAPDGRYAVAGILTEGDAGRRTEVIDLVTGAVVTTLRPPVKVAQSMRTIVHPDGRRVISTYLMGEAFVWDIKSGAVLWQTDMHVGSDMSKNHTSAAAVSPDGHLFAFGDADVGIRLVNADTYADVRRWDAHNEMIWSLAFSPGGKWLLSASIDDTIGVWDVATGKLVARLVGHGAAVFCAAMSPDGTRIASGGRDGYLRLWDTKNFENVAQFGGHKDYIYSLAWSSDGKQLVSASGDSTVRIWDTRTLAEQLAAVRARSDAVPGLETRIAKARAAAPDARAAVESVIASQDLGARERELARQVAARFAFGGMPAYYRAQRAKAPIVIDGRIDEAAWSAAPWSEPFVDIEGDSKPKPRFETRMRMLWDDEYLYIAARLQEPHVWGTLTQRDAVVFHDNDFEVFIDPAGHARWYSEIEVNALGTIFDLRLDRPYSQQGNTHFEWSPPGLKAAIAIDGTLNDPSDTDRGWTVELAIPHSALAEHAEVPIPPRPGDVWRINFSRVEWQHEVVDGHYVKRPGPKEDNWVWTPQHVVNMHVPENWGFVEFIDNGK